jgi:primosomal protein N' (replication factor Y)
VFAAKHDYDAFAENELRERSALGYPPFAELIYLGTIGRDRATVLAAAERYAELLRALPEVDVLGPAPYPIARVNDEWRFRLAIKATDGTAARRFVRETIVPIAEKNRDVRVAVNVDP